MKCRNALDRTAEVEKASPFLGEVQIVVVDDPYQRMPRGLGDLKFEDRSIDWVSLCNELVATGNAIDEERCVLKFIDVPRTFAPNAFACDRRPAIFVFNGEHKAKLFHFLGRVVDFGRIGGPKRLHYRQPTLKPPVAEGRFWPHRDAQPAPGSSWHTASILCPSGSST